ncbi:unnamed protein product [Protopolystoma xenopodis]|uniref:Uncharacterized protein n=1 Tax=Protopolystoma xenopodis TaxID=117903 RepID=A0A3S5C6E7_9PLAT|nr:unnamed protein product [Protopolystoma xenopodis]
MQQQQQQQQQHQQQQQLVPAGCYLGTEQSETGRSAGSDDQVTASGEFGLRPESHMEESEGLQDSGRIQTDHSRTEMPLIEHTLKLLEKPSIMGILIIIRTLEKGSHALSIKCEILLSCCLIGTPIDALLSIILSLEVVSTW